MGNSCGFPAYKDTEAGGTVCARTPAAYTCHCLSTPGWDSNMQTVVHVTHEAIQKIGGIGAVLHGLLTSRVYLDKVPRNILVGPFWPGEETGDRRLGSNGEVLYSSLDHLYRSPLASRFREIEQTYGVGIVYGRRKF